jgi:hypothetical protein
MITIFFFKQNNLNTNYSHFAFFFKHVWTNSFLQPDYIFKNNSRDLKYSTFLTETSLMKFNYGFKIWNYKHYRNFIPKIHNFRLFLHYFNSVYIFKIINVNLFISNFKNFVICNNFFFEKNKYNNFFFSFKPVNFFFDFNVKFL